MKNFSLVGAAGYIAPRHMRAIQDTGNQLVAAFDPNDSVGVIDSFFPDADFFVEFERFDRHIDLLRRNDKAVDYFSICSPNYLHDAHIRHALRNDAHAICEKPIVLTPWNIDALREVEREGGTRIYNILQLRLHPAIKALREKVKNSPPGEIFDVDLTYLTSRGHWYSVSWKGDDSKSGGVAANIGVHFFDMLGWVFGPVKENTVHLHEADVASGYLEYEQARVRWFLSINADYLPEQAVSAGKRTYRSIRIGSEDLEFSDGFTELHTESYRDILTGGGFGLEDARPCIETVYDIRHSAKSPLQGDYHPLCRQVEA